MMKNVFYAFVQILMRISVRIFFNKLEIIGMDRIPKNKPCIFSPNHQNAFLDALIIGGLAPIKISYLTRSDVFDTPFRWFLDALQMIPIYRMRDGYEKLSMNDAIFQTCRDEMKQDRSILIFSEGNHGNEFPLRPLSRGSSRLALESQEQLTDKDLYFVPVGLNYYHHQRPGHKFSLVVGEPLKIKDYLNEYEKHKARGINHLKKDLSKNMQDCLIYAEEDEHYTERKELINRKNEHYDFYEMKERLKSGEGLKKPGKYRKSLIFLADLISVVNFGPLLLIWKSLRPIKDIVFKCSLKYAIGIFGFPIWWLLLFIISSVIWNWQIGLMTIFFGIITLLLRIHLIRMANPPH